MPDLPVHVLSGLSSFIGSQLAVPRPSVIIVDSSLCPNIVLVSSSTPPFYFKSGAPFPPPHQARLYSFQSSEVRSPVIMPDHNSSMSIDQSSPSSGGVDSPRGTPGTKVTEFSPEDGRGEPKVDGKGIVKASFPPTFSLQGVPIKLSPNGKVGTIRGMASQDPFTTGSSVLTVNANPSACIKLSPTAVAFMPLQSTQLAAINTNYASSRCPRSTGATPLGSQSGVTSTVSYLNATSVPDLHPHRKITENLSHVTEGLPQPPIAPPTHAHSSGTMNGGFSSLAVQSTNLSSSRYLKVCNVPKVTTQQNLNEIFSVSV